MKISDLKARVHTHKREILKTELTIFPRVFPILKIF